MKKFKCEKPVNAKEVAEGLLLMRDGPKMFYGDSNLHEITQMYKKPVTI